MDYQLLIPFCYPCSLRDRQRELASLILEFLAHLSSTLAYVICLHLCCTKKNNAKQCIFAVNILKHVKILKYYALAMHLKIKLFEMMNQLF